MALVDTLSNVKRMNRSTRLREEGISDEEIMSIMEEILQNALISQASGSPKAMRRAINEMRQVRKDVRTGQVKASTTRQKNIIGRFSNLVDQLEQEEQSIIEQGGGGMGGIASSLPSVDTLVSAVMTANPLLGYSTKIIKDLGGSVKQKAIRDKEAAKRQAQTIEEQRDFILDRMEVLDQEKELTQQQMGEVDTYKEILQNIESELSALRKIWDSESTPVAVESEQTNNRLSELVKTEERLLEEQRLQRERDEFNEAEARRMNEDGSPSLTTDTEGEESGGLLGGLAAMLGGGIMTGLSTIFGILSTVGTAGLALLKVGARASIIGSVFLAIYDFVEGFFNAGDILDMAEEDLNIGDRLIAGISNVVAGFGKLLDTILNWFDIDIIDSENLSQRIGQGVKETVDNIFNWLFGLFDNVKEFITEFDIGETLTLIKNETMEFMDNLLTVIPDAVKGAFDQVGEFFSDIDWFGSDSDEALTEEGKEGLRGLRNPAMSFSGQSASKGMTDTVNSAQASGMNNKKDSGGVGVISGNNNTTINNNTTNVTPLGNTSNLDPSIRDYGSKLDRLRRS
jgi:predicted lipid-binding transport protein (Tim44 family)